MARKFYGLGAADVAAQLSSDGDFEPPTSRTFDVFRLRTGGSADTALQTYTGATITAVTAAADGTIRFQGADGYTGSYWLQDQAFPSNPRVGPFIPHDTVDRLVTLEAGSAGISATIVDAKGDIIAATAADAVARKAVGADGTVLTADSAQSTGLSWGAAPIPQAIVDAKGDLIAGTAADTVAKLTVGANGKILSADSAQTTGLAWIDPPTAPALDSVTDVDATSPVDGATLIYDQTDSTWKATDSTSVFAGLDANGDLAPANYPPGFVKTWVVNQGDPNPPSSSAGDLLWVRTTAVASLGVSSVGAAQNGTTSGASQVVANSAATFASGDYAVVCISVSAEATYPTSFTVTGPTGIGAMTLASGQPQGTTVGSYIFYGKATATVALSQNFTVTAVGGTASRNDWAVHLIKVTGLAASAPIDLATANGGTNTTSLSVASSGPTTAASEVAIACFGYNPVTAGAFTPTGGWNVLVPITGATGNVIQNTDAGPKAVAVVYKILTATAVQTATGSVVNPAVYSAALATFKAA